ncbi:MAG: glycosyltransferase family 2 protein [Chlorobium sp.]|nr:MAG: glycosyltransferase family 2 protein [Chlorobium sp.]
MDISVVIPLYNKKDTIERALESVRHQSLQPKEIIVVNDGSTDGSEKIAEAMNVPDLRIIHQQNAGVSAARNRGIYEAESEWIAFLDADDEWMSDFLETIRSLQGRFSECTVCATAYRLGDQKGNTRPIVLKRLPFIQDGVLSNYFEVASCSSPPICSSAVCVKKTSFDAVGGFPEGIRSGEDLLTWARLAASNNIAYTIQPHAIFWQDPAHTYQNKPSRTPQKNDLVGRELQSIKMSSLKNIDGIDHYIAQWHKMRASIYLRLNIRWYTIEECLKSLRHRLLNPPVYAYLALCVLPDSIVQTIFKHAGKNCPS